MATNNANESTEVDNTDVEDTGTQETEVIDAGDTATGDESGVEDNESAESELVYDIDGEEVSASTVLEWKKGNLRQADYTKKTQVTADTRRELDAEKIEINALKTSLNESISKLEEALNADSNDSELEELRTSDTGEYLKRKEQIENKSRLVQENRDKAVRQQQEEDAKLLEVERQLLTDALPAWQDPKQKKADLTLIETYVKDSDFSQEDFNKLGSHKLMITTLKAAKFDELQRNKEDIDKQVQKAPNVIKARVKTKTKAKSSADLFYGKA